MRLTKKLTIGVGDCGIVEGLVEVTENPRERCLGSVQTYTVRGRLAGHKLLYDVMTDNIALLAHYAESAERAIVDEAKKPEIQDWTVPLIKLGFTKA